MLKSLLRNPNVINGIVSGIAGTLAAILLGTMVANASKIPKYYVVTIAILALGIISTATFVLCSRAVLNAIRGKENSSSSVVLASRDQTVNTDPKINSVISLYDSLRNTLAADIFSVLWHREDPAYPMQFSQLCRALRDRNPEGYVELDDRNLMQRIEELVAIKWLPTLNRDDAGFSLKGDTYALNAQLSAAQKDSIGQRAAEIVTVGSSVGLDSGTTALRVAHSLAERVDLFSGTGQLYIYTPSVGVCNAFAGSVSALNSNREGRLIVSFLGGEMTLEGGTSDATRVNRLPKMIDIAFLGANGIDAAGFYLPSTELLHSKELLLTNSTTVYVVADSSKLGRKLPVRFASWESNIHLIVDRPVEKRPAAVLKTLPRDQVIIVPQA